MQRAYPSSGFSWEKGKYERGEDSVRVVAHFRIASPCRAPTYKRWPTPTSSIQLEETQG